MIIYNCSFTVIWKKEKPIQCKREYLITLLYRAIKTNLLLYYSILKASRGHLSLHSSLIVLYCCDISLCYRWVLWEALKLTSLNLYFGSLKYLWYIFCVIVEGQMKCWRQNGFISHCDSFMKTPVINYSLKWP